MTSVCVSDWRSRYSASWILYAVFTVTSTAPIFVAAQKVMYHCGHVGGPDGHVAARLDAHATIERAGERVHVVAELAVGAGVVQRGVLERVLVGELLDHPVEHLREGQVDELVLLPDVLAGAGVVEVERAAACRRGVLELLHDS